MIEEELEQQSNERFSSTFLCSRAAVAEKPISGKHLLLLNAHLMLFWCVCEKCLTGKFVDCKKEAEADYLISYLSWSPSLMHPSHLEQFLNGCGEDSWYRVIALEWKLGTMLLRPRVQTPSARASGSNFAVEMLLPLAEEQL
jgi:hypothetical protein